MPRLNGWKGSCTKTEVLQRALHKNRSFATEMHKNRSFATILIVKLRFLRNLVAKLRFLCRDCCETLVFVQLEKSCINISFNVPASRAAKICQTEKATELLTFADCSGAGKLLLAISGISLYVFNMPRENETAGILAKAGTGDLPEVVSGQTDVVVRVSGRKDNGRFICQRI